jgi:hypothetical protein
MRYFLLILLLFIPFPVSAQSVPSAQIALQDKGILIHDIEMDGFVLGNKDQFVKLFKPYRNKYLTKSDMDAILMQIQVFYEREGYQQLVSITYQVVKHRLIFTALMTS